MALDGWEYEIVAAAEGFVDAGPGDCADALRALHATVCTAPGAVTAVLGRPCDRETADNWIRQDALHELAFDLAGRAGMIVSRTPAGDASATLFASGLFEEVTCTSESVPLAVGAALAAGLVSWSSVVREAPQASRATH